MERLIICCLLLVGIHGYAHFRSMVPNGGSVPHPCRKYLVWHGLGHLHRAGGGNRNRFGNHFHQNGKIWNACLCRADSDGDGRTNGEELGDPECTWKPGQEPEITDNISHPGICEPIESKHCREMNKNLGDFCMDEEFKCDSIHEPGVKRMDIRIKPTKVPAEETTYYCAEVFFPTDDDYHVIATDVYNANPDVLHHVTLDACHGGSHVHRSHPSRHGVTSRVGRCTEVGDKLGVCYGAFMSWSLGRPGMCIPRDQPYGIRIGKTGYRRAIMEIHWNNPELRDDHVDSSGVTLWYTRHLRHYDAGILKTGIGGLALPPHQGAALANGVCHAPCLQMQGLQQQIHIFASLAHMHFLGKKMFDDVYFNGTFKRRLLESNDYKYDYPDFVVHHNKLELNPGEEIRTRCEFDTSRTDKWTYFGESSQDEMCLAFHWYYPLQQGLSLCVPYGANDRECFQAFPDKTLDPVDKEIFAHAQWLVNPDNNVTASLIQDVLKSCDQRGVTCLPGCQDAINALKVADSAFFSNNDDVEYALYSLVHTDIKQNEPFVSAMRSCATLPASYTQGDLQKDDLDEDARENETPRDGPLLFETTPCLLSKASFCYVNAAIVIFLVTSVVIL